MTTVCNDCLQLHQDDGPACAQCQTGRDKRRTRGRYAGERTAMRKVTDQARRNPETVCHLCGSRTPPEIYQRPKGWVADHDQGTLKPAHAGCNSAKGGRSAAWFVKHLQDQTSSSPQPKTLGQAESARQMTD